MTLYLRKRLPDANVRLLIEKPAPCFDSVKGIDVPEPDYAGPEADTDVCIVLDTNSGRISNAEKYFEHAKKKINIDHHISNAEGCGDLNYVDPHASSASELVFELIEEEYLDEDHKSTPGQRLDDFLEIFREYADGDREALKGWHMIVLDGEDAEKAKRSSSRAPRRPR